MIGLVVPIYVGRMTMNGNPAQRKEADSLDVPSEKLQKELLTSYLQLSESYALYVRDRKNLSSIVSELVPRILRTKSAKLTTFAGEEKAILMDFLCNKNAVIAVNSTGKQLHSTLAFLSYLRLSLRPRYNLYAVTQVKAELRGEFLDFVSANNAQLCVIFEQAVPYLDGFHLLLPTAVRRDRSKEVIDFVSHKGHEIGAYSVDEDEPTFQVIHTHDLFLNTLATKVPEVYGFAISDDIWAGVNAAAFVLGDFDFGISAQPVKRLDL